MEPNLFSLAPKKEEAMRVKNFVYIGLLLVGIAMTTYLFLEFYHTDPQRPFISFLAWCFVLLAFLQDRKKRND